MPPTKAPVTVPAPAVVPRPVVSPTVPPVGALRLHPSGKPMS